MGGLGGTQMRGMQPILMRLGGLWSYDGRTRYPSVSGLGDGNRAKEEGG